MPILDQKLRYFCQECGQEIDVDAMYLKVAPKYCYTCRQKKRDGWKRGQHNPVNPKKREPSKFIRANIDWYNAGLCAGSQGYLRDRFQSLLEQGNEFLEAKQQIEPDPKWQAEIKGLTEHQRHAYLIGFFISFNGGDKA